MYYSPDHDLPGIVYLVGAGPGDPELITHKGLKLLRRADVVLYDALVDTGMLEETSVRAERIYVGKRAGRPSIPQHEINRLLLENARRHACVVRLKGGDPFVFGRGGEEMHYLRASGIRVEIVPGISSALAGPAALGIPVTHRGLSRSFSVITGSSAAGRCCRDEIGAVAGADTLVVLMGVRHTREIGETLVAAGRSPDGPAVAVQDATWPTQRSVIATVATLADAVAAADLRAPGLLIYGDVTALATGWPEMSQRPLPVGIS